MSLFGGHKKDDSSEQRTPVEAPEGVIYNDDTSIIYLSKDEVEVFDLIGEGEIDGLVTGDYQFSGNIGDIGWTKADGIIHPKAPGTDSRWLRSVMWNDVPVVDSDNKFNFQQIDVSYTRGFPNGAFLTTNTDNLITTRPIGERLRGAPEGNEVDDPANADYAKTYRILNKNISAIIISVKVQQLLENIIEGEKAGDVERSEVNYSIYYRPVFTFSQDANWVLGKTEQIEGAIYQNGYIRSSRINLTQDYSEARDFLGYEIRIVRSTPDSTTTRIRNTTFVESISEVYSNIFRYPYSAIVKSKFDAEFFSQIPSRKFDTRLLKVKVPDNYNSVTRTYGRSPGAPAGTGDYWTGTFKTDKEWTNNPAWCFYDLITNRRYGLGKYIDPSFVNKFILYKIARYCDELVPDGFGGVEPRFTCNIIFTGREEAIKVVNDLASVFRAMVYYSSGGIFVSQDSPKNPKFTFNNTNVENGEFKYQSSAKKVRHTVAIVRYNDKNNFFKPAFEVVENIEAIKRYGIRELQISALGTTSRGQARRLGKWALYTEAFETESCEFTAGLEAEFLRPGDVISIADRHKSNRRLTGRLIKINNDNPYGAHVTLDTEIPFPENNIYNFNLITPTFKFDHDTDDFDNSTLTDSTFDNSSIQTFEFTGTQSSGVTVNNNFVTEILFDNRFDETDYDVLNNTVYSIELTEGSDLSGIADEVSGSIQKFRVLKVEERESKYVVNTIEYEGNKFLEIESGLYFSTQGASDTATSNSDVVPTSPTNLALSSRSISDYSKIVDYSFTVPSQTNIQDFYVHVKKDSDITDDELNAGTYLYDVLPKGTKVGTFIPAENGTYYFRVRSRTINGAYSINTADNNIVIFGVNPLLDVSIHSLRTAKATAETNDAGTESLETIKEVSPTFLWNAETQAGSPIPSDIKYRITIRKKSDTSAPNSTIYDETTGFTAGVQGIEFDFDIDDNIALTDGPYREYDVVVEAHNNEGNSSAGGNFLTDINSLGARDSIFNNPEGYDIVHVNNPQITGLHLSEAGETQTIVENATHATHTDQWIDAAGNINIHFITGNVETDVKGGFMYFSEDEFTQEDASGLNLAQRYGFVTVDNTQSLVQSSAALSDETIDTGWLAFSLYDDFDLSVGPTIVDLLISNVVSVSKRGLYNDSAIRSIIDDLSGKFADHSGDVEDFWENFVTWSGDVEADITNLENDLPVIFTQESATPGTPGAGGDNGSFAVDGQDLYIKPPGGGDWIKFTGNQSW